MTVCSCSCRHRERTKNARTLDPVRDRTRITVLTQELRRRTVPRRGLLPLRCPTRGAPHGAGTDAGGSHLRTVSTRGDDLRDPLGCLVTLSGACRHGGDEQCDHPRIEPIAFWPERHWPWRT